MHGFRTFRSYDFIHAKGESMNPQCARFSAFVLFLTLLCAAVGCGSGGSATTAPSISSSRLVFTIDNGGIYSMAPDGGNVVRIAQDSSAGFPSLSRDRARVVYTTGSGVTSIVVRNTDGVGLKALTTTGNNAAPAFLPDGRILFVSSPNLMVMNADGSAVRTLAALTISAGSPTVGPDGTQILAANGSLTLMNADGSGARSVPGTEQALSGRFSPDGIHIVFSATRGGMDTIFVTDLSGAGVKQLTSGEWNSIFPVFSPDGASIAYLTKQNASQPAAYRLFIMNADGTNAHQIGSMTVGGEGLDWR